MLLDIQSSVDYSSLMDSSTLELEKPHSFGEVTSDTAPTIFKGATRKYKDLEIKEAWFFRPEQRASTRDPREGPL